MLKFLLILFIVIYAIGYIGKLLFANWIRKMSNQQMNHDEYDNKKEGEVTINLKDSKGDKKNRVAGDYVDYEEVD